MKPTLLLVASLSLLVGACGRSSPSARQPTKPPVAQMIPTSMPMHPPTSMATSRPTVPTPAPTEAPTVAAAKPTTGTRQGQSAPPVSSTEPPATATVPAPAATNTAPPAATPTSTARVSPPAALVRYVTAAEGTVLYSSPSTKSTQELVFPLDAPVTVQSQPVASGGTQWYRAMYGKTQGYIAKTELTSKQPPSIQPSSIKVPVLEYHDVGNGQGTFQVTMPAFKSQIAWLLSNGYKSVTMSQIYEYMYDGKPLPAKPVAFTFDDGRLSQWNAVEELRRHHMVATLFIMGSGTELTWAQLKEIASWGNEIGCHSMNHTDMKTVTGKAMWTETVGAKLALEKNIGVPIHLYAWPFGAYNQQAADLMAKNGYWGGIGNGGGGLWDWAYRPERRWYEFRYIVDGTQKLSDFIKVVSASAR